MHLITIFCILGIILLVNESRAVSNEEKYENYIEILNNCTKENGITVENYIHVSKTKNMENRFEKAKCVDACMFKIFEILKPDGTIDLEKALQHLLSNQPGVDRNALQKNIELCSTKKEDNECDTAHNLMSCALGNY